MRLAPDVTVAEIARLAKAMTFKNAAAGLAHGGGKAGIIADRSSDRDGQDALVRAFARAIDGVSEYIPGPDMGTNERAMALIHDEIGRAVGLPAVLGGIPLDEIGATGFGLAIAAETIAELGLLRLDGARVVVQGFGAVGRHVARFLAERGAKLVGASDSTGAVANPAGLDIDELAATKTAGRGVAEFTGGTSVPRDSLIDLECDIWIPAARPDVITTSNAHRLRTKVVLEGANIPATREAEQELHRRGILVVPDFIANAGGVICAAVEHQRGTRAQAFATIEEKIRTNARDVLTTARARAVPPRQIAEDLAAARVSEAAAYRRRYRRGGEHVRATVAEPAAAIVEPA